MDTVVKNEGKPRDVQLDLFRGLIMIYILCVIHVAYWLSASIEPYNSLILFEMPLIFFVSGAALQVSNNNRSVARQLINRVKRVLVPYYIYIVLTILMLFLVVTIGRFMGLHFNFSDISIDYRYVILPLKGPIGIPCMSHLWFIVPFLVISCSFPMQRHWASTFGSTFYMILITLVFGITCFLTSSWIIREILGYNIFYMMGYFYYKRLKLRNILVIMVLLTTALIVMTMFCGCKFTPMQLHKFPPDFVFIIFGVVALSFWGAVFTFVKLPDNQLLRRWNKYGYTIYLWQSVVFMIVSAVLYVTGFKNNHFIAQPWYFFTLSVVVLLLSTALSYITVPIEMCIVKIFESLVKKLTPNKRM